MASWQDKDQGWAISKAKLAIVLGAALGVLGVEFGDTLPGLLVLGIAIVLIPAGLFALARTWRR